MSNLILVILCFFGGYVLKRSSRFPYGSHKALNGFIIHISLPALVLYHIHSIPLKGDLFLAGVMPWIVFFIALVLFWGLYKMDYISRKVAGALVLTAGLGNTSFVGLPLISAYYGSEYLGIALIIDQLGTFLCLGTVGVVFAFYAKDGVFRFSSMGKMVLFFPPSQALVLALLLRPYEYPVWLEDILQRLGDTLTPLALVSVGLQLSLSEIRDKLPKLSLALGYKLVLAPLIVFVVYVYGLGITGMNAKIIVFESAMAPMITSSILAMENDLEPDLSALILGLGIVLSLVTTSGLYFFLEYAI